jgi:hypothetical protein
MKEEERFFRARPPLLNVQLRVLDPDRVTR